MSASIFTDSPLVWVAVRAFVITLILTPVFRDIFRSYWIVDQPDEERKRHGRPIPRVGGIPILIGYFVSFVFLADLDQRVENELWLVWKLLPAVLLVFATGLIDDFFGLKPYQKLAGQFVAALLAYWAGVRIAGIGGYSIEAMVWSLPVTLAWLLVCTNAFNLVDGLDGLAAGVGFFATLTIFVAALLQDNLALAFATLPLAGALIGFLCFNFNPATIFLGDSGSLLIGFLLGCYGAVWSSKSVTLLGMTAPLIALSIPLLDVLLCVIRRFLRARPIFSADRGHIHHRLVDRGLTPRGAVLVIYALSGIAAAISLMQGFIANIYLAGLAVLVFGAVVWAAIRFLGYAELMLAGRVLRSGGFQHLVNAQLELEDCERAIAAADSVTACWDILCAWHQRLGFEAMRMRFAGTQYELWPAGIAPQNVWSIRVPLGEHGWIEFARRTTSTGAPLVAVASLVQTLITHLPAKAAAAEAVLGAAAMGSTSAT